MITHDQEKVNAFSTVLLRNFPLTPFAKSGNIVVASAPGSHLAHLKQPAEVAELADAQASGACGRKIVWVQVPSSARIERAQKA